MEELQLIFNIFDEIRKELLTHINFESYSELDTKKEIIESELNPLFVWITRRLSKTNKLEYKLEYEDLKDLHQKLTNKIRRFIQFKIINEESVSQGYYDEIISIYEKIDRIFVKYKKSFPKEESIKKVYHCEVVQYVFQNEQEVREHIKKMEQDGWNLKSHFLNKNVMTNQTETCVTYEKRIEEE